MLNMWCWFRNNNMNKGKLTIIVQKNGIVKIYPICRRAIRFARYCAILSCFFVCVDLKEKEENVLFLKDFFFIWMITRMGICSRDTTVCKAVAVKLTNWILFYISWYSMCLFYQLILPTHLHRGYKERLVWASHHRIQRGQQVKLWMATLIRRL